jgi:hypothetical protein
MGRRREGELWKLFESKRVDLFSMCGRFLLVPKGRLEVGFLKKPPLGTAGYIGYRHFDGLLT